MKKDTLFQVGLLAGTVLCAVIAIVGVFSTRATEVTKDVMEEARAECLQSERISKGELPSRVTFSWSDMNVTVCYKDALYSVNLYLSSDYEGKRPSRIDMEFHDSMGIMMVGGPFDESVRHYFE